MTAPLCDIDPEHGEMQPELMYEKDGVTVRQYGWFCRVKDCDGYGGPVGKAKLKPIVKGE